MLKGHPKGLIVAAIANMGERFGYYTMLAIFLLFLQAKYGLDSTAATQIFGIFLAAVYFMPLLGGIIADRWLGYGKTISIGLVIMFIGYVLLAIPTTRESGLWSVIGALAVIALGTGFFKGNLQVLVGNMYDDPKYSKNRDNAFNIFYMCINVGAMFAPTAAEAVSNYFLKGDGFFYNASIPALAQKYLAGDMSVANKLSELAVAQGSDPSNLGAFANNYIVALGGAYHWAFAVACVSLVASMAVFWGFRKYYKDADMTEGQKAKSAEHKNSVIELTPEQTKNRLIALGLVFFVVIFFWMAFHQNGATMTMFARDYTVDSVDRMTNIWFDLLGLLPIFFAAVGAYFIVRRESTTNTRLIGAAALIGFAVLAYLRISNYGAMNPFTPQKFQHFNPFFIVALTPIVVGMFSWMNKKGIEPSAPRKIGFGMLISGLAFIILVVGSFSLTSVSPKEIHELRAPAESLVSPYWLISTYFILTIAELFLSPMGISFVSKVAPPKYKGLMQGGWFAATAIGNYGVAVVALGWSKMPLWMFWMILVTGCLLSFAFIFSVMKRLETAAKS